MRKLVALSVIMLTQAVHADTSGLQSAIEAARQACSGISEEMSDMKKKAGITTAVTAVGTVSGGVALGAGLAKSNVDKELDELLKEQFKKSLNGNKGDMEGASLITNATLGFGTLSEAEKGKINSEIEVLYSKSKKLGNLRTGTLAAATVSNIAGAALAGTNTVKEDLETRIKNCVAKVDELSRAKMQASIDGSATAEEINRADAIYKACSEWSMVDLSPINKRAKGAAILSGVGAGLGLAGTITSAQANSDGVRSERADDGGITDKEKNLNKASNVLAGGTAAASLASTVFSATQISAIKRAATVADECEGAL